jgi:hypothetical protein
MPSHVNWVCFECKAVVRRSERTGTIARCPSCGADCVNLVRRARIPPKRDARAWKRLRASFAGRRRKVADDDHRARLKQRRDLERRIRDLEARPASAARTKVIKELRRRLGSW